MAADKNQAMMFSFANNTGFTPSTLILTGIPGLGSYHIWFGVPVLFICMFTLMGNCALLLGMQAIRSLQRPMHLLISQIAMCDLVTASSALPKMLVIFFFNAGEIDFHCCLLQMFFLIFISILQSSILSAMAFDQYVAVCNPLRYSSVMTSSLMAKIAAASLSRAVVVAAPLPLFNGMLPFCSRHIAHTFCENMAVAKLSCADITFSSAYAAVVFSFTVLVDILCIVLSYIVIILAVLSLHLKEYRFRAFSTCTSHICVLTSSYLPFFYSLTMHRMKHGFPLYVHIIGANIGILFPPWINPLIYGITMKDIQQEILKRFRMVKF